MAEFLDGIIFKLPQPKAPDFVKGSLSIKRDEFIKSLQGQPDEWVNMDLKVSKAGKGYAQLNTYKKSDALLSADVQTQPKATPEEEEIKAEDIPF
jgi:hypothetical protein